MYYCNIGGFQPIPSDLFAGAVHIHPPPLYIGPSMYKALKKCSRTSISHELIFGGLIIGSPTAMLVYKILDQT